MIHILRGEGIECERETEHALKTFGFATCFVDLPKLFSTAEKIDAKKGDWIFVPGGFSFADHLGSGRLLAYELSKISFFDRCIENGISIIGACNGFQVLVQSGIFGDVELLHNQRAGEAMNFCNRWVKLKLNTQIPEFKNIASDWKFTTRHGEGRLKIHKLATDTQALLYYADENFDNGSDKQTAGLYRRVNHSKIVGLMPHAEIRFRPEQDPDFVPGDCFAPHSPYAPTSVDFFKALMEVS